MLATVSMQPMARPASAMTEASTFTSRQKGMVANTREMAREEAKRAHSDWARLQGWGRGQRAGLQTPQPHPPLAGRTPREAETFLSSSGWGAKGAVAFCRILAIGCGQDV